MCWNLSRPIARWMSWSGRWRGGLRVRLSRWKGIGRSACGSRRRSSGEWQLGLGKGAAAWHFRGMSLNEVQKEAVALSAEERRKLAAFLTALRMKETGEWAQATQPAAPERSGWVSLDEAKHRLLGGN